MEIYKVTQTGAQVQSDLNKAASAYQKPATGIPATDLAEEVQLGLAAAGSAYQKPETGIPAEDLSEGVQANLAKAERGAFAYIDTTLTYNDSTGKWEFAENPYNTCLTNWDTYGQPTIINLEHTNSQGLRVLSLGNVLMLKYTKDRTSSNVVFAGSICTDENTMVIVKLTKNNSYAVVKTL